MLSDRIRHIPPWQLNRGETSGQESSVFRYHIIGLVRYTEMVRDGNMQHHWVYLCENAESEPVLITERYDISMKAPDGTGIDQIDRDKLRRVEEERLTQSEFQRYRSVVKPFDELTADIPITLNLPQPPVPPPEAVRHGNDCIRRIPLCEFDGTEVRETDLSAYRYQLIGLLDFRPCAGQGDIEYNWVYLCKTEQGEPVLLTETFDLSVWSPNGSGPEQVSRDNLCGLEEERLTQLEFQHYGSLTEPVGEGMVHLPITLYLRRPLPPCPTA